MTALRFALSVALVALVVWLVLVPQFDAASDDFTRLAAVPVWLVVGAALLEIASLLSNTVMTTAVLNAPGIRFGRLLAIDLADLGASHALPGGGAAAGAIRYRLLRAEHVPAMRAVSATTVEVAISNVSLCVVFASGTVFVLGRLSGAAVIVAVVVASSVVILATAGAWMLLRRADTSKRLAGTVGNHVAFLGRERSESFVSELSSALRQLAADRRRTALAVGGAVGNWILDAASLWLMILAFGHSTDVAVLVTAYGIGTILAQLPLTPGGVGIVEAATTAALVGLGVGHAPALLGVLGWRIFEYLLPTPIGWLCFLYLRVSGARAAR